ncbi:MAG: site-specific integrase [Rhodococcus sp. (in: high G+C Gram-positive bacteria)]|nr:MAG: site-specific integrase [Rhodococcus sp. (in: high G+C Gram-positive bacteria)]
MLTHLNTVTSVTIAGRLSRHVRRPASQPAHTRSSSSNATRTHPNTDFAEKRHSAATRLANDPAITLTEVRAILRHADIKTTSIYTAVRVEDLFDKLQEHYAKPRPTTHFAPGYDPDDVRVLFGG